MYQHWETNRQQFPTLGQVVQSGLKVFDDTWDTYVPEHKKVLCDKIIRYYWFYQIGAETPDRFVWYINEQLARIMPYYNQLYMSELIKFDPMLNHSIQANGRSIENLLKDAQTGYTKTGKAVRDFINKQTGFLDGTANVGVKSTENIDKTVKTVYNKDGTDDSTTTTDELVNVHAVEDTDTTMKRDRHETEKTTSNLGVNDIGHSVTVVDSTKVTDDDKDIDIVVDGVTKDTDTGTVVDDGSGTSVSAGTKDWTEVKDDTAKTTVVTDLNETTNSSARKDYADTPQKQLTGGGSTGSSGTGADGLPQIRSDYLTNVTWDYSTGTHSLDSTVTTDFKDDETKTHTEKTSDDTKTTNENTRTTNMIKDGTAKTTTDHTEDNQETEKLDSTTTGDTTQNRTEALTKDVVTDEDTTEHTLTHHTSDTDKTTHGTEVYDDDWTEKGNADEVTVSAKVGTNDTLSKSTSKEDKEGRENEQTETGSTFAQSENTSRTIDTGKTDVTTGFMNIPSSALLEAFRKTFLNIDQKIIDDLRENFLCLF